MSRSSPKHSEPALHLADNLPHLHPVCTSCGYLPLPVHSALPHHQRQGISGAITLKSVCSLYCFIILRFTMRPNSQVMFKVRQAKATPAPPPRRTRIRRTSSRRSGYAFSHMQGYGELVTSGRFLRRPAVSRASGFSHVGRATTGFSPMGRSAGYSPTGRPQNTKAPDVEVTSLQMYRTFSDGAL